MLFEVCKRFRISGAEGSIPGFFDITQVKFHSYQVVIFLTVWAHVPGATQLLPPVNMF